MANNSVNLLLESLLLLRLLLLPRELLLLLLLLLPLDLLRLSSLSSPPSPFLPRRSFKGTGAFGGFTTTLTELAICLAGGESWTHKKFKFVNESKTEERFYLKTKVPNLTHHVTESLDESLSSEDEEEVSDSTSSFVRNLSRQSRYIQPKQLITKTRMNRIA